MNMYKGKESVCSSKDKTLNSLSTKNTLKKVCGTSKFQGNQVDFGSRHVIKRRKQAKVPKIMGKTRKTSHPSQVKPNYMKKHSSLPSSKAKKQKAFKLAKKKAGENVKFKLRAVGKIVQFIELFSGCNAAFLIFQVLVIFIFLVYNFLSPI
ncbi:uncharacterized protein [Drosophila kikkawai]|uniref:Uncharacterized protein n=1 Tax=Drosophila kikkawai TaxID=30033 RepID=A0A6P4I2D4_DROKI|nr:uncharacterized protein LOC108074677 [Drosophila kikkawai]